MSDLILEIYRSPQTVFSLKDLALLIGESSKSTLKAKANYYVKKGDILGLRKGVYAKEKYNPLELANKIYTPSYISLETVLQTSGIIFQYYKTIFAISYLSREIKIKNMVVRYRKIKNEILCHPLGLENKKGASIATSERAFLDTLYLYGSYHFYKLDILDKEKVFSLLENVYKSKKLDKQAKELLKNAG